VLLGSIAYDFSHSNWYRFRGTGHPVSVESDRMPKLEAVLFKNDRLIRLNKIRQRELVEATTLWMYNLVAREFPALPDPNP
ncbi:MAG TPA: hypothetical protein PLB67_10845, partial [Candidatus Hydrogenedentes bacterium]|nr:hypothetical protein [Candidatus Hydrogenedentota bacterium]